MKLTAFNHTNINVMGQIRLPVKHRDVVKNINFIVTNIDTATIIGRNDAVDLHCVGVYNTSICNVPRCGIILTTILNKCIVFMILFHLSYIFLYICYHIYLFLMILVYLIRLITLSLL